MILCRGYCSPFIWPPRSSMYSWHSRPNWELERISEGDLEPHAWWGGTWCDVVSTFNHETSFIPLNVEKDPGQTLAPLLISLSFSGGKTGNPFGAITELLSTVHATVSAFEIHQKLRVLRCFQNQRQIETKPAGLRWGPLRHGQFSIVDKTSHTLLRPFYTSTFPPNCSWITISKPEWVQCSRRLLFPRQWGGAL